MIAMYTFIWASSWDYGTCHIGDQWRLRGACATAQSHQSLRCSPIWNMEVKKRSDQKSEINRLGMAAHVCLKKEFTEDEKCHNLMTWLIYLSHIMRKPVYAICKQQRCRSACALVQSDQRLYCLLPGQYNTVTCCIQKFQTLASF